MPDTMLHVSGDVLLCIPSQIGTLQVRLLHQAHLRIPEIQCLGEEAEAEATSRTHNICNLQLENRTLEMMQTLDSSKVAKTTPEKTHFRDFLAASEII